MDENSSFTQSINTRNSNGSNGNSHSSHGSRNSHYSWNSYNSCNSQTCREIEKIIKFCIYCDTEILSNVDFFYKTVEDELPTSITICGFCYNCKHHVVPLDCYSKAEFSWTEDDVLTINQIYTDTFAVSDLPNPLLKKQVKFK